MPIPRYSYDAPPEPGTIAYDVAAQQEKKRLEQQALIEWQSQQDEARLQRQMMRDQADVQLGAKTGLLAAETDDLGRRNRLGLSPITLQLADRNSAAYEQPVPPDITIGDMDGGAPAGLPMVRPLGISPMRARPQFQEALDNLGTMGSRTRSVDEAGAIEQAKADERIRVAEATAALRQQQMANQNQARALETSAKIQASDKSTDVGQLAQDFETSAGLTMQAPAFSQPAGNPQSAMQAPAFSDAPEEVLEDTPKGKLVKRGGRYIKIANGVEEDVTDGLKARGLI